jgi:hypothetical protein
MKPLKIFIINFLLVFGLTMSMGFLYAGEWSQSADGIPHGFVRPVVNEGSESVYYTSEKLLLSDDFLSGTDNFYVNTGEGRVGIGNTSPQVALDISGGEFKLGNFDSLPACDNVGFMVFLTSNNLPYICTNSGWEKLHADIDGDGQY